MLLCPRCHASYNGGADCPLCAVPLVAAGDPYLGRCVADFVLFERIAGGTETSVYRARGGNTDVAVKIYEPGPTTLSPDRIAREREAQQRIEHPYVARVLDWGSLPGGQSYLATQWVEGTNLESALTASPLPWRRALGLVRDLATGLAAVHAAGVVHRDLKPSNVVLTDSGEPPLTILDFGHSFVSSVARLTQSGVALGSVRYMAPEQAAGGRVTARADLYSAGVILYRALTGVLPFDHVSAAEVVRLHQREPVTPPSQRAAGRFPQAVEDLCLWLLAKTPEARVPNTRVLHNHPRCDCARRPQAPRQTAGGNVMTPLVRPVATAVAAALTMALAQSAVRAQPEPDLDVKAKAHFTRGQELVDAKRYREALAEFSAGYELSGRPAFLFNMAECARLSGDQARAVDLYRQFVREAPEHQLAALAARRLEELAVPPEIRPGPSPVTQPPPLPAPQVKPTPPASQSVSPAPASLALKAAPIEPRDESRPLFKHWGFWAGVGAGAVAIGVTSYFLSRDGGVDCETPGCIDFRD
jgi:hypothetical protein